MNRIQSNTDLVLQKDWSKTPLGPRESWPTELTTLVQTTLATPFPILLAWGPELTSIYNSGYAELLGGKHPQALGTPVTEVWAEIADHVADVRQKVLVEGQSVYLEDHPLFVNRDGTFKEAHFTYAVSPLRLNNGQIMGAMLVSHDTTDKVATHRKMVASQIEAQTEKEKLHALLMQAPVCIAILEGPDLVYSFSNTINDEVMGKTGLIGQKAAEAFPELVEQGTMIPLLATLETGQAFEGQEIPMKLKSRPDRELSYFNSIYMPYRDPSGKIVGVMLVGIDVTEQVEARNKVQESENRYRNLTDTLPHLIWTAKANGEINYANQRCLTYTGLGMDEKSGQGWAESVHPDDVENVANGWTENLALGTPFEQEYRIRRWDGQYRWFLGRSVPVKNSHGQIEYWIGAATDIEDQKQISRDLHEAKELAERANETKSNFLANMSHEIRTPLGAILGFSGLLKDRNVPEADKAQYIDTIVRNGESLTRIIDDILDLAKVEAGRLEVDEAQFSLSDMIQDIFRLFEEKARVKSLRMSYEISEDVPVAIASDPVRVRQILINIVGNAIKFTARGGVHVRVTAQKNPGAATMISVSVIDTGPGLSDEQKSRLFTPFTQVDNTLTRRFGGTGLGLALSKRLSEALGGTIAVSDNTAVQGCVFTITFKAQACKEKPVALARTPAKSNLSTTLKDLEILLVDDSPDNRDLVQTILEKNGAIVDQAVDGEDAVQKSDRKPYDIILMDIQMPGMDGYEAMREIKRRGTRPPVIALTAHAMVEERQRTQAAGFAAHVTKPIQVENLLETIRQSVAKDFLPQDAETTPTAWSW